MLPRVLIAILAGLVIAAGAASATPKFGQLEGLPRSVSAMALAPRLQQTALPTDSDCFGTCPSPNRRCHTECDLDYADRILECLSGAEGILPYQRNLCYAKASLVMGVCHKVCDEQFPF